MAHHVIGIEKGKADTLHFGQNFRCLAQSGALPTRQIYLGYIAIDNCS